MARTVIDWQLRDDYEEGMEAVLRDALADALDALPPEHLRAVMVRVLDRDPRGKALGIWRQDGTGVAIELYAAPHVRDIEPLPPPVRELALRLHLAYTLAHEVGHHVTRFLNQRAAPRRKSAQAEAKSERWADEYAEKRLGRLVTRWRSPGGRADSDTGRKALFLALKAVRLDSVFAENGTNTAETVFK